MKTLQELVQSLNEIFDGDPWHGPTIKKILSDIPAEKVDSKIGQGHSIIEIVLHMAAWKNFVVHKLQGDTDFDISEETNFPKRRDWGKALIELEESHKHLVSAIASFDPQKLQDLVPHRKYSFHKLLHGIVHHDLYHLGQITMIIKQF